MTTSEITSHVKWYVKYVFLKEKQQIAIDKWKWNKTSARKVPKKASAYYHLTRYLLLVLPRYASKLTLILLSGEIRS